MHKLTLPDNQEVIQGLMNLINLYWKGERGESESQSSFWKHYSSLAKIQFEYQTRNFQFEGTMFGDYRPKSSNPLKFLLPASFFANHQLTKLSPQITLALKNVCRQHAREINFDCLKQALSIQQITENGFSLKSKKICIIGDGYGFLGCLLKNLDPTVKIVSVNLGKISVFDVAMTSLGFHDCKINFVNNELDYKPDYDFNFIPAEVIFASGVEDVDLFFNIASMQEMTQNTIDSYFTWMRSQQSKPTHFYCCNRVSKTLPSGEIIEFKKFGWKKCDQIVFDEICPWYQGSPSNRPPFWKKFDGKIWHRFVKLR